VTVRYEPIGQYGGDFVHRAVALARPFRHHLGADID
jgi:hypothetical protein